MKDYQYYVDMSYDTIRDCEAHSCNEEGICRCGQIVDIKIKSVDLLTIYGNMIRDLKLESDIDKYGIDRILRVCKSFDLDLYEASVTGGYYEEEIDEILFKNQNNLEKLISEFLKKETLLSKVRFLLEAEYGYLCEDIADITNYSIEKIPVSDIKTNKDYSRSIKQNDLAGYQVCSDIYGLVLKGSDYYRLIDGFHRFLSNQHKKEIKMIVATK